MAGQYLKNFKKQWIEQSSQNLLPQKQHVLLVTHGRSGSSFTSALISRHENVFFLFEPLFVLQKRHMNISQHLSVSILESLMKCEIPPEHAFLLDNLQFRLSSDTSDFYKCFIANNSGLDHVTCFLKLLDECQNHSTWFAKSIRFRLKWAETFLDNMPNFKLLYLVRDPRASLLSQSLVFRKFNFSRDIENVSKEYCSLIEDDMTEAERLVRRFPERVKGIRYEDGATDPFKYTQSIYNFLELTYNDETERYIQSITRAANDTPDVQQRFSVIRKNSVNTMNNWRGLADFKSVQKVDILCGGLYSKLGYRFVHSETDLKGVHSLVDRPQSEIFL